MTISDVKTCLWFPGTLCEAIDFYTDLLPGSTKGDVTRHGDTVVGGDWTMAGRSFRGINGGNEFPFTPAVSLSLDCADQAEVDHYWGALTADGGKESQCGWCTDRFGLSWQVIPVRLYELFGDRDPARARAAVEAMFGMSRIVVAELEAAADKAG